NETHDELFNVVHIDEKWFFMTKLRRRFYMWHDEEKPPPRQLHSKAHITKVMFLVAVARPRHGWDGKVGCWPFLQTTLAIRSSVNRPAGTPIVSPLIVNKEVYREYLIDKVIPAIKSKWIHFNSSDSQRIYMQQDNARPHVSPDDAAVASACHIDGWDIQLMNQPPNSPDLNILDLGFFNSIQALQQTMECQGIPDLVDAVVRSFNFLSAVTLDKTFGTLKRVMRACLDANGDNKYDMPRRKSSKNDNEAEVVDDLALQALDIRLEEEDRLDDLCSLVNSLTTMENVVL
ncbi:hypothetical protein LEN26_011997, partial [Aphanomyces euteiches]